MTNHPNRSQKPQFFAFAPVVGLNTDTPQALNHLARVFQVAGGKHRCRLALEHPNTFMEVDCAVHPGGIEVIEKYRADQRWQEITDASALAEIERRVGWPERL